MPTPRSTALAEGLVSESVISLRGGAKLWQSDRLFGSCGAVKYGVLAISHCFYAEARRSKMDRPKKKLLLPDSITAGGWAPLKDRDDVEGVAFKSSLGTTEFHALLARDL